MPAPHQCPCYFDHCFSLPIQPEFSAMKIVGKKGTGRDAVSTSVPPTPHHLQRRKLRHSGQENDHAWSPTRPGCFSEVFHTVWDILGKCVRGESGQNQKNMKQNKRLKKVQGDGRGRRDPVKGGKRPNVDISKWLHPHKDPYRLLLFIPCVTKGGN